jgi:hypothetical protein
MTVKKEFKKKSKTESELKERNASVKKKDVQHNVVQI